MNANRTSCGEVRERLPLYVGGDLDLDVLDSVRGHLELCRECAVRADDALRARRELVAAFRAREADVARPELWPAIRATLRAEGLIHEAGQSAAPRSVSVRARWSLALAPLAAAAVMLAIVQLSGWVEKGGHSVQPIPEGPRVSEVAVDLPVSAPATGTLRTIPADESLFGVPYRRRWVELEPSNADGAGDASLAGFQAPLIRSRLSELVK